VVLVGKICLINLADSVGCGNPKYNHEDKSEPPCHLC
jgi:hypothetical protein